MSLAEFLEWNDGTDTRYELIDGRPRAIASPIEAHGTIVANLARHVGNRLNGPAGSWPRPASRVEDGWKVQDLIGDAAIPLAIDGEPLPLSAIYDSVAF